MKRAEIILEDAEQGANVRFVFAGGFDSKSPAHQLAQILQTQMDRLASDGYLTPLDDSSADAATVGNPQQPLALN